jgi:hypothetical protein
MVVDSQHEGEQVENSIIDEKISKDYLNYNN